jgi:hypothetical protein
MPHYRFSDPAQTILSSIKTTTDYVGAVLTAFSLVALGVSSLLFIIVMMVSDRREQEGSLFALHPWDFA